MARLLGEQREQQQLQIVGAELTAARHRVVSEAAEPTGAAAAEAAEAAEWAEAMPAAAAAMAAEHLTKHLERAVSERIGHAAFAARKTVSVTHVRLLCL